MYSFKGLLANDLNWITIDELVEPMQVTAKVRYGTKEGAATVTPLPDGSVKVMFEEAQRAVTPGTVRRLLRWGQGYRWWHYRKAAAPVN